MSGGGHQRPYSGPAPASPPERGTLAARFAAVRRASADLARPLTPEDQTVQSMPDASPTKWHLAHTTWFFETVILSTFDANYKIFNSDYRYLFNSYYESLGTRHPRPQRGLLTRPSCADIERYRAHVDNHMSAFIVDSDGETWAAAAPLIELGCHHEEQHQELILMDILHAFSCNPTFPAYHTPPPRSVKDVEPLKWMDFPGGDYDIGHDGKGFAFDNECPRHTLKLKPFRLSHRLVTNGEWLEFIADGGYRRPEFWLSDGWAMVQEKNWTAPLYWVHGDDGARKVFTLGGLVSLDHAAPVCHVSFYEADAFARWAGKRLPTESEWEVAAADVPLHGNFAESGA
ncbi:MAG: ergothioneine biosynthesis protein EgtB, partial [Rhodospirillaceae bacterium]